MATITLVQAAKCDASGIHTMTAMPIGVDIHDLVGGAIQFGCSNLRQNLAGATSVEITYDAAHGSSHQTVQLSSIMD